MAAFAVGGSSIEARESLEEDRWCERPLSSVRSTGCQVPVLGTQSWLIQMEAAIAVRDPPRWVVCPAWQAALVAIWGYKWRNDSQYSRQGWIMSTFSCIMGTGEVPLSSTFVSEGEDLPVDGVDRAPRSSDAELFRSHEGKHHNEHAL